MAQQNPQPPNQKIAKKGEAEMKNKAMKFREKEQIKIRLDDIIFDFKNGNKNRAFERLVDVIKILMESEV